MVGPRAGLSGVWAPVPAGPGAGGVLSGRLAGHRHRSVECHWPVVGPVQGFLEFGLRSQLGLALAVSYPAVWLGISGAWWKVIGL